MWFVYSMLLTMVRNNKLPRVTLMWRQFPIEKKIGYYSGRLPVIHVQRNLLAKRSNAISGIA